jgi:hypothetical protein
MEKEKPGRAPREAGKLRFERGATRLVGSVRPAWNRYRVSWGSGPRTRHAAPIGAKTKTPRGPRQVVGFGAGIVVAGVGGGGGDGRVASGIGGAGLGVVGAGLAGTGGAASDGVGLMVVPGA